MKVFRTPHEKTKVTACYFQRCLCIILAVVAAANLLLVAGCDRSDGSDQTTLSSIGGPAARDIVGSVGEDIEVEDAVVTVRALEVAFQPAMPTQRLSDETPTAPGVGESFYQAYVRVENNGSAPVRVDPEDFMCAVGSTLAVIEPTRSGPIARSLIPGTSLDLLLTFKGPTGFEPVLMYNPPWHDGIIKVSPETETPTTSTTEAP